MAQPDPLAKLRQETDAALATEVMEWSRSPNGGHWYGPPDANGYTAWVAAADWSPTSTWPALGTVLDVATSPTGFIRSFRVAREDSGTRAATATTLDGQPFNGYGQSTTEALANALLKAAREGKVDGDE